MDERTAVEEYAASVHGCRMMLSAAVDGRLGVAVHHNAADAGWPPCTKLFCAVARWEDISSDNNNNM